MTQLTSSCKQATCKVQADGKCLEGFSDLKKCPHHSFIAIAENRSVDAASGGAQGTEVDKNANQKLLGMPTGEALDLSGASEIMASVFVQFIVLAGAADSGKTTLAASLYERFQSGPFAGYNFAGSRTLQGFELRCHDARLASNRTEPTTLRTTISAGERLLHIRVRSVTDGELTKDVLLYDISGESYERASSSPEECRKFSAVGRADYFVLLVDAVDLSNIETRANTQVGAASLLRMFLDSKTLRSTAQVDVLFTKWDEAVEKTKSGSGDLEQVIVAVESNYRSRFADRVASLKFHRVAASPKYGNFETAHGLDTVFPSWVERSAALPASSPEASLGESREFSRFQYKTLTWTTGRGE